MPSDPDDTQPLAWPLPDVLRRLSDHRAWGIPVTTALFPTNGIEAHGDLAAAKAPHRSVRSWPTSPPLTADGAIELAGRWADTDDDDGIIPGLGLITGELVVIDVDDQRAYDHPDNEPWRKALESTPTLTLRSVGKGLPHRVYRAPATPPSAAPAPTPTPAPLTASAAPSPTPLPTATPIVGCGPIGHPNFGDVKGDGGYVCIANAPPLRNVPVAPLPEALLSLLRTARRLRWPTEPLPPPELEPEPSAAAPPPPPTPSPTPAPTWPTAPRPGAMSLADVIDWYAGHAPGSPDDADAQRTRWVRVIDRFERRVFEEAVPRRVAMLTMTRDVAIEAMAGIYDAEPAIEAAFVAYCEARQAHVGLHGSTDTTRHRQDFVRTLADDVARLRDPDSADPNTAELHRGDQRPGGGVDRRARRR